MADTKSLYTIGLMLGAATMMVMMIGTVVISDHLSGRLQFDGESGISLPAAQR